MNFSQIYLVLFLAHKLRDFCIENNEGDCSSIWSIKNVVLCLLRWLNCKPTLFIGESIIDTSPFNVFLLEVELQSKQYALLIDEEFLYEQTMWFGRK